MTLFNSQNRMFNNFSLVRCIVSQFVSIININIRPEVNIIYISCALMQKYEILSAIGEGAYGVVLKCKDVESNTFVAIKKFKDSDEQQLTRKTTIREVKILKMLSHENIVQMKEAFRKKGIVYLVFEYVENNLLQVLQKSPSGLQPGTIRKLMYQLVKGLAYLHNQEIVHRDIKPENLLVSSRYDLKICDFGFARTTKKQKNQVEMTDYVATRWYRPPELLVGGEYGKQIDMWAVGCILCELIDGNPLFPGENQLDQLFLIQKTFGPLPQQLHERFVKNQRFLGMKFPQIQNLDPIDKKYFGKIDPKGLSFIKALLKLIPSQRLTAQQALKHPYFDAERSRQSPKQTFSDARKQIHSSTATRKKQEEYDLSTNFDKLTKYGKIYNKRKTTNYNQIAMIYQSSNQCKLYQPQSKSVNKPYQKKLSTQNQNISLQKHRNKELLLKTEGRGFCFQRSDDKIQANSQLARKTQDMNWQSTNQLPFLIVSSGNQQSSVHTEANSNVISKKKPQIMVQKVQTQTTNSSGGRSNISQNFVRR